jgi:hypothetical protein
MTGMDFDDYVRVGKLVECFEENFPENYGELIEELIIGKTPRTQIVSLQHLCTLLLNTHLNKKHLYSEEEIIYLSEIRQHSSRRIKKIKEGIDDEFTRRKGKLTEEQKIRYSNKIEVYSITSDNRKWALINWEDILSWYNLPFYKKWFNKCPKKEFTEIK